MESQAVTIQNKLGLHAYAATKIVKTAQRFVSQISLEKNGIKINAKSIMGIFLLEGTKGSVIRVTADGADEKQAVEEIVDLFKKKFGEPE